MAAIVKKFGLWLVALFAVIVLFFLYRKGAKLRNEIKLLQNVELKRKTELEELQRIAQVESDRKRLAQLKVELSCLRSDIRARDEALAETEKSVKVQTDRVLKAKSFAELERVLKESRGGK